VFLIPKNAPTPWRAKCGLDCAVAVGEKVVDYYFAAGFVQYAESVGHCVDELCLEKK
jgi:hypothetical protein